MTQIQIYKPNTVFLSFLERERDRDFLNVLDRDLVQYDRFRPFTVPERSPFLTVPDRFRAFYVRFRSFDDRKRSLNDRKRSGTVRNGQEHLGTIESERSNALERIVENGHAHASKTKETL